MSAKFLEKLAKRAAICCISVWLVGYAAASESDLPRVVREVGGPVLELPKQLMDHIKAVYPELHLPESKDLTGSWSAFRTQQNVPYACWGDFNGDGKTDVALILLDGPHHWRLLAFLQTPSGGYVDLKLENFPGSEETFTRTHAPQEFHLWTIKAGEKLLNDHQPLFDAVHKFDAIGFFLLSDPGSGFLYQWTQAANSPWPQYRQNGFFGVSTFGRLGD